MSTYKGFIINSISALGIGAASFSRRKIEAETEAKARKDIAESPTAEPERPEKKTKVEGLRTKV